MSKRPAELTPLEQNCFVKLAHRRKLASETVAYVWEDCHQWVTGLTKYFTATVKPFLAAWVAAPKGAAADAVLEPREFWGAQMRPSKLGVLAYFDTLILVGRAPVACALSLPLCARPSPFLSFSPLLCVCACVPCP